MQRIGYLLSPEDSVAMPRGGCEGGKASWGSMLKTMMWIGISLIIALALGQLV
jgi:hypothetical protein